MEESTSGQQIPKFELKANYDAKLKELLHWITSIEIKLCSDATKEFIKLLKGENGRELLYLYVKTSSKFTELLEAWNLRQGKDGMPYVMNLIKAILSHRDGLYKPGDAERGSVSRALDKLAQVIMKEKMGDVYKELNSKDGRRQSAALSLLAAVVRRGSGLASEVAKSFDFTLEGFLKLAECKMRKGMERRKSTRKAFVEFAMSFLQVGKPGLLRWILQQRKMYSGVLRGLGDDDEDTVVYVLSTLRDRVLTEESLVPPGLRSVLFGRVTLDQLVSVSGRMDGGPAAELAYNVLFMVCTDPFNGLMPNLRSHGIPLKGNPKRLLELMKKLKATEIVYHRDLLLEIVRGRPYFGSAYLEAFPYSLEDHSSPNWFPAITLAARLISSVATGLRFDSLVSQSQDPPSFEHMDVQSVIKCICPSQFTRTVMNKGLLHSDILVKHGTLRLLLEAMKLLDSFIGALDKYSSSNNQKMQSWANLKQNVQNEVRVALPDPQVLLNSLSSSSSQFTSHGSLSRYSSLKRAAKQDTVSEHYQRPMKKLKNGKASEDTDIIVGGIDDSSYSPVESRGRDETLSAGEDGSDDSKTITDEIIQVWGLDKCSPLSSNDAEMYFSAMLLHALKLYIRTIPLVLEGSFDFFMNFLNDPLSMPTNLQHSWLSLLTGYIGCTPGSGSHIRTPLHMYKHLQLFLNLLIFSPNSDIKEQAYKLAWAALLSTGAFDRNIHEIDAWFMFLPGYTKDKSVVQVQGAEVLQSLILVIISFLCDAVSTVGNNLFKYWDVVRCHIYQLEGFKDVAPDFSPFIICVLQKSLRLLSSSSGTFTPPQKSMISLYVCNTMKYLIQNQVDVGLLSACIESFLSGSIGDFSLANLGGNSVCEWWPVKSLLLFTQSRYLKQSSILSLDAKAKHVNGSLADMLKEVRKSLSSGRAGDTDEITKSFCSAFICTTPDVILDDFPSLLTASPSLHGVLTPLLSSIFYSEHNILASISKSWPDIFFGGLEMAVCNMYNEGQRDDSVKIDASESGAVVAFSNFLTQVPFHVLFLAFVNPDNGLYLLETSKIRDLLVAKLSNHTTYSFIPSLRLLLFWIHQVQSFYKNKPSVEAEKLLDLCFILLKHLLGHLSVSRTGGATLSAGKFQEVVETIFNHPIVSAALTSSLECNEELRNRLVGETFEDVLRSSGQRFQGLNQHVLDMLTTICRYLFSPSSGRILQDGDTRQLVSTFNSLVQRLLQSLKDTFDIGVKTKDLSPILPAFDALDSLINFLPPFELLELVHWMFSGVNVDELTVENWKISALSVGCHIAAGAFGSLSCYLKYPMAKRVLYDLFWEIEERKIDVQLVEETYMKMFTFATRFQLQFADKCLLKAVDCAYRQKYLQYHNIHILSLAISQIIVSTPMEILSHCINNTNSTKANILCLLTQISPLHLTVFGHLLNYTLNNKAPFHEDQKRPTCNLAPSDDDFLALLPAAFSYLNLVFLKFKEQHNDIFKAVSSLYSRILLNGFTQWGSFVSGHLFQEEYGDFLPSSIDELLNLFKDSLLGKAIHMLHYHFAFSGDSIKVKKRMKLFDAIVPRLSEDDLLLDCDIGELKTHSVTESFNLINSVIAKISVCKLLLFPGSCQKEADKDTKEIQSEKRSRKLDSSRMRFMEILVSTWLCIVKELASASDSLKTGEDSICLQMYGYLEVFILKSILHSTTNMHDGLTHLQSIAFLERLVKSAFLYRFDDSSTMKMLCSIFSVLSDGRFSRINYIQLLLAHSQFAPCIQSASKATGCTEIGALSRPMSSILRSLAIPSTCQTRTTKNDLLESDKYVKSLEVIKLLRRLIQHSNHQVNTGSWEDIGINLQELQLLLLSSYDATHSELDLEIYHLMIEIDSLNGSDSDIFTEMDYLWGSAALKMKKEWDLEQSKYSNDEWIAREAIDEHRRSKFRESLPIDPRLCASTVLHFPLHRTTCGDVKMMLESYSPDLDHVQRYDPGFILRFSIHSLSMGYLEPLEFAGLGLLAVALMSLSSLDNGMRKLAYETLGRFKNVLEESQKRKDVVRLRLLLTYVQNGIEEPWQKIPSIIALFAAESSCVLLDPSHDHYTAIHKLLTRSSRVNLKSIPLFQDYFWSSSVNFKMERLWILRLAYAGLNSDDDAQIYIRNSVLETSLSFYVSPLGDDDSRELILQILKKSVKLPKMTRYLVEHCGLFPWLSSIVTSYEKLCGGDSTGFLNQMTVVLKIVSDVTTSRSVVEWLQIYALEQLMELSSHLYNLMVSSFKLTEEFPLVDSILQILTTTLKISQKRKIYQPHFTLSVYGLLQIYQVVNICQNEKLSSLGLKVILMSTPPITLFSMSQEQLSDFAMWAIAAALSSDYGEKFMSKDSHPNCMLKMEVGSHEVSLTSKLLRWLSAAVIVGKLPVDGLDYEFSKKSDFKTLESLLEHITEEHGEICKSRAGTEGIVAAIIFYLQLLCGINFNGLPSVVSALCILLHIDSSMSQDVRSKLMFIGGTSPASVWSKIRCPAEASSSWRWTFYQPWKDLSLELTDQQKMEEHHACLGILSVVSTVLRKKSLDALDQHPEISRAFAWERSILEALKIVNHAPLQVVSDT